MRTEIKALIVAILIGLPSLAPMALTRGEVFPDSSVYLDAGRNLFTGNGFVTKINLVARWPGKGPHEVFSYYNPLFMFLSGLAWYIVRSTHVIVLIFGTAVSIFNGWLLFLIARKMFGDKVAWVSMSIFLMTPAVRGSSHVLGVEQVGLASGFLAVMFLLDVNKKMQYLIYAGISMALGFFLQVSSLYNAVLIGLAFLLWRGFNRKGIIESALLAITMVVIVGGYEAFCFYKTGKIYPTYPEGAKNWSQSTYFAGTEYHDAYPVLRAPELDPAFKALLAWRTFPGKVAQYSGDFWKNLIWISIAALTTIPYFLFFKRKSPAWMLMLPAFLNVAIFSLTFYWLKSIETHRYAIFPIAFLLAPTIYTIERFINWMKEKQALKAVADTFQLLLVIALCVHLLIMWIYYTTMLNVKNLRSDEAKAELIWLNAHTKEDEMIAVEPASELIGLAFYLNRPIVVLPYMRASTLKNLQDFFKIFGPKYVGIKKVDDEMLRKQGYYNNRYHKYLPKVGCVKVDELKTRHFDIWKCKD